MKKGNKIVLTKISGNLLQADLVNILQFLAGQMAYHTCHVWMDPGLPINKKQVLHTGACDQKIHRHIYIYTNFLFLCPSLPFMDNSFLNALSGTRYVGRSCLGQGGVVVRRCHRKAAQVWGVRVQAERSGCPGDVLHGVLHAQQGKESTFFMENYQIFNNVFIYGYFTFMSYWILLIIKTFSLPGFQDSFPS